MMNEGASGQMKGSEFTRPFPFGDHKWKKIFRALLCVKDEEAEEQNWIHSMFFFGGPKEFKMGPNN